MTDAGVFSPAARAAIIEAGSGRCVGCGRHDVTTQHRRARGMGGTSDVTIGHPANGVPLCGDGVRGCHGWTEHNPTDGALLGWRLVTGEAALETPWWDRLLGWRRWFEEPDEPRARPYVGTLYVDLDELDRAGERLEAVARYRLDRPLPVHQGKPTR